MRLSKAENPARTTNAELPPTSNVALEKSRTLPSWLFGGECQTRLQSRSMQDFYLPREIPPFGEMPILREMPLLGAKPRVGPTNQPPSAKSQPEAIPESQF
jgi:hypothetical protein